MRMKLRFDEINIGERFMVGAQIAIKNSLFFCGGGPYNAVSCGFSGAGRANFPFFVTDDKEVELLTHMETHREVDVNEVYRCRTLKRNEMLADPGPQKGPSSTSKIDAEVAHIQQRLEEIKQEKKSRSNNVDPSFPSSSMGYL